MNVILIDSAAFEQLKIDLYGFVKKAVKDVISEIETKEKSDWITLTEAQKMLPYKSKTSWQKFRDTGVVKFTKTENGRHIMYSRKSIVEYLSKNKIGF